MVPAMPTALLSSDADGIAQAASMLRAGGLVAFPTETVYGLGAHALDVTAVRRVFEAKARPANDPLIVHLATADLLRYVADPTPFAERLASHFWPGPLTVVLHKKPHVPTEVTAGLDTIAIRVPSHSVAHALLAQAGIPVAAPSANLFSRPSPTRAEHVLEDLGGRIDAILDGGPTPLGLESTIVDLTGPSPRLLRPGGLPAEAIEAVLNMRLQLPPAASALGPKPAPGLLPTHYAPRTPLVLILGDPPRARARLLAELKRAHAEGKRAGALLVDEDLAMLPSGVRVESVCSHGDDAQIAARLFGALRALDRAHVEVLFALQLADPNSGFGRALADRLRRAAAHVIEA
jgi:L-threonylcarbamoyladenylate synthase